MKCTWKSCEGKTPSADTMRVSNYHWRQHLWEDWILVSALRFQSSQRSLCISLQQECNCQSFLLSLLPSLRKALRKNAKLANAACIQLCRRIFQIWDEQMRTIHHFSAVSCLESRKSTLQFNESSIVLSLLVVGVVTEDSSLSLFICQSYRMCEMKSGIISKNGLLNYGCQVKLILAVWRLPQSYYRCLD